MMPVSAVTYTTPDGVERSLRFTLGARKRIADRFGQPDLKAIFAKYGDGALPEIAYSLMYDDQGKPPKGLAAEAFAECVTDEDSIALLAAVMSAADKGRTPKNEIEALLKAAEDAQIGLASGPSPGSASESQPANSGTSPSENLTPSLSDSKSESEPPISDPA